MRRAFAAVLGIGIAIASPALAQVVQTADGVWRLTGHVAATACADRCATRRQAVDQEVVVTNGQLSGAEGLLTTCAGGVSESEFDGLVTLVPGRRGWQKIRVVDRPRFRQVMRRCIGYPSLRLGRLSGRVLVAADGRSFDEIVYVSGSVAVAGRTVTFSGRGRLHAEWVRDSAAPANSVRAASLARVLDAAFAAE